MDTHSSKTQLPCTLETPPELGSWQQCFEMITGLVPHESLSENELDAFDEFLVGCDCQGTESSCSDPSSCSCCQRLPLAYDADHRIKWLYLEHANHQPPIVECGILCSCTAFCSNRVVGNCTTAIANNLPTKLSLEVFATDRKGYALKTLEDIASGTFVCEYAGELISLEEAARRTKKHPGDTYIFLVQEQSGPDSVPVRTCIDARHKGSLARFINHSCQANLYMIPVRIDINVPRLACFAKQNIPAGEELTVNYAQQSPGETYISSTLCECASSNCRKYLPFQPDLFSLDLN